MVLGNSEQCSVAQMQVISGFGSRRWDVKDVQEPVKIEGYAEESVTFSLE